MKKYFLLKASKENIDLENINVFNIERDLSGIFIVNATGVWWN